MQPVLVAAVAAVLAGAVAVPVPTAAAAERAVACRNDVGDAELINRTIAVSAPGDEIVFDGTCLVDETIMLVGDRTYRGRSRTGTVVRQADGANLDAILASDSYLQNSPTTGLPVVLRSLTIEANSAANPDARDAVVLRSWQTVVEDVQISDATRHGIRLTNLAADGTPLTNTQVNGRIAGNQINRSGGSGVHVEDTGNSVTDWQLQDNYVATTGADGISIDNAAGWIINGNHVYGVGGENALYADRLFGSSIGDNYIEDFGVHGILARVQGDAASTIAHNRIFKFNGGAGTFLHVEGIYGRPTLAVTGNAVRGNGTGVGLDYQRGDAQEVLITSSGNSVHDVSLPVRIGEGVSVSRGALADRLHP